MIKIGKFYICDRCGNTGFSEYNVPLQRNALIVPKSINRGSKVFGRRIEMLKIEKAEVCGFEAAIRGMRNPMNSWGGER